MPCLPSLRPPPLAACAPASGLVRLRLRSRDPSFGFESDARSLAHCHPLSEFIAPCTNNATRLRWMIFSHSRDSHHPHQAARKRRRGRGATGDTYLASVWLAWETLSRCASDGADARADPPRAPRRGRGRDRPLARGARAPRPDATGGRQGPGGPPTRRRGRSLPQPSSRFALLSATTSLACPLK